MLALGDYSCELSSFVSIRIYSYFLLWDCEVFNGLKAEVFSDDDSSMSNLLDDDSVFSLVAARDGDFVMPIILLL